MRVLRAPVFVQDATDAYAWLASESPRASERFLDEIEALADLLPTFPDLGREREEIASGIRSFRLRRFRYVVFYRFDAEAIVLLRVVHGARDLDKMDFDP